jgi:hypothetical protein
MTTEQRPDSKNNWWALAHRAGVFRIRRCCSILSLDRASSSPAWCAALCRISPLSANASVSGRAWGPTWES